MKIVDSTPQDGPDRQELTGLVENVVYHSEDTGYTVFSMTIPDQKESITVVGHSAAMWVGETVNAEGEWVRHKKHGLQFRADSLTCIVPTSAKGIERYLASGMIQGIRKVMAKRLVQKFGKDTLRIIEKESKRLEEVEGIGPMRRDLIKSSWIEQKAVRDIMIFLQGHGVGTAQSARIYRQYGNDAIARITDNPYRLCQDIWGIGFKSADGVAMSIGIPANSELRARAGLTYTLRAMTDEGHCFCPVAELILQSQALLDIPAEILTTALEHQTRNGQLVNDDNHVYVRNVHEAEIMIAEKLTQLRNTPAPFKPIVLEKAVPWAELRVGIAFDPKQREAVSLGLSEKVSIITGGPGVGKTTIIRALVEVFAKRKLHLHLAAPTGRAAKRMEEATRREAKTIHRLLKYTPRTGTFEHDAGNPIKGNVVILDEVSMIDVPLMSSFLSALPNTSSLILVGDTDQLPSVGPGNVLRDLIASDVIPCVRLEHIFRQASGGLIVQNAHHVNNGEHIDSPPEGDVSDFYFIESGDPDHMISTMIELVTDRIPRRFGLNSVTEVQVLTPMRKNKLGSENLNTVLQEAVNPKGHAVQRFGRNYRIGDRVMQIRNNYDKDTFNGDIGLITAIEEEEQKIVVDMDGRNVPYEFSELDELVLAYACSIHKSQGSEYPAVVLLIATQHYKLLQRNLLYTAITRGRKLVCLVGSSKAVGMAIRNNEMRLRRTRLMQRLIELSGSGNYIRVMDEDGMP